GRVARSRTLAGVDPRLAEPFGPLGPGIGASLGHATRARTVARPGRPPAPTSPNARTRQWSAKSQRLARAGARSPLVTSISDTTTPWSFVTPSPTRAARGAGRPVLAPG